MAASDAKKIRVIVATTAMLSFISFWSAAAVVLNDLASSAFYAAGIAEKAAGRSAPWFILAVMLFSYAVRSLYIESCAMFTRGGVYRVVKEAMGGTLAKIGVSALLFDYALTGPISAVSAGQYIVGLLAQAVTYLGHPWQPSTHGINHIAAGIAILVTLYFWWRNIIGIRVSSADALKIMKVTTVMAVVILAWGGITLFERGAKQIPPSPAPHNLQFPKVALGWVPRILPNAFREVEPSPSSSAQEGSEGEDSHEKRFGLAPNVGWIIGLVGIFIAFGHSVLAMSGEESLAQVNREIEHPKHKNLMRAGFIIFVYSLVFTSAISFMASLLIPDSERPKYFDNLISGLTMNFIGPLPIRLALQAFVVVVGFLILSGAVNTSIVGANGVLNRISEDGVLTGWFRAPHKKYGSTYRMINLIVFPQIAVIIASRGNVYLLGEAYAFGIMWSFALKGIAMVVLRFKDKSPREWKVPGNIRFGQIELPFGIASIAFTLLCIALINLFTKEIATISGIGFTIAFFIIFTISERRNAASKDPEEGRQDQFTIEYKEKLNLEAVETRPGNVLVLVRNNDSLKQVQRALEENDPAKRDVVVMTVRLVEERNARDGNQPNSSLFTEYEQTLFTSVVKIAEKAGKTARLIVVPSNNLFKAVASTAIQLLSTEIVAGASSTLRARQQVRLMRAALDSFPKQDPAPRILLKVVGRDGRDHPFYIGVRKVDPDI
jgi:amino acid transporter